MNSNWISWQLSGKNKLGISLTYDIRNNFKWIKIYKYIINIHKYINTVYDINFIHKMKFSQKKYVKSEDS